MVSQKVVIKNSTGLHLRPAGILCKEAMRFLKMDQLPDKKHKVMVVILRRKMYAVSIGVCHMFYKIFKKRRRI